jgi:hypothetical protein
MNVQIRQIKGDIVELVFNPKEEDLRVGESLTVREKDGRRGLIVQVIELRTVNYPSLLREMLELVAEAGATLPGPVEIDPAGLPEMSNLKLAIAKIRKVVRGSPSVTEDRAVVVSSSRVNGPTQMTLPTFGKK